MRRLIAWVGGIASGLVAYRFWRRHRADEAGAPAEAAADSDARAEELRAKLAESRAAEPVVEEPVAEEPAERAPEEPAAEEPESPQPESPEERRRRVHDEGRAALDEMQSE
jgi:hypothetical protein